MKVKLTGIVAELLGSQEIEIKQAKNVADLKQQLLLKKPELNGFKMKVAVNSILAGEMDDLHTKDEVIVFGAYAGG